MVNHEKEVEKLARKISEDKEGAKEHPVLFVTNDMCFFYGSIQAISTNMVMVMSRNEQFKQAVLLAAEAMLVRRFCESNGEELKSAFEELLTLKKEEVKREKQKKVKK